MAVSPSYISQVDSLIATLSEHGIEAVFVSSPSSLDQINPDRSPDLALLDLGTLGNPEITTCIHRCSQIELPTLTLVPTNLLGNLDPSLAFDDFVTNPPNADELVARATRLVSNKLPLDSHEIVRIGELVINPVTYEVSVRGRSVNLRFKEYELLLLMATNPGRVYTREALLEQIWGYHYLGGTRTVDVHIRRLRSKIEGGDHRFIETVWNVGYRFRGQEADPN